MEVAGRRGDSSVLTSTPFAYPQVVLRTFASFRVLKFSVSTGQRDFYSGFDSRQLHKEEESAAAKRRFLFIAH